MADGEFSPIETQEALDAIIKERVDRARRTEREKFADYADLKAKAARLDEQAAADGTELDQARRTIEALQAEKQARERADELASLRAKVSAATGVPAELVSGEDEGSMTAFANAVAAWAKRPAAPVVPNPGTFAAGTGSGGPRQDFSRFMADFFSR